MGKVAAGLAGVAIAMVVIVAMAAQMAVQSAAMIVGGAATTAATGPGGGGSISGTDVPAEFHDLILRAADLHGVPWYIIAAFLWKESGWSPDVIACARNSSAGARGIAQFMPSTAATVPREPALGDSNGGRGIDPCNPAEAILAGAWYLRVQYDAFGSWDLALAAYNAGPGAVRQYGGIPPYTETINHVRDVMEKAAAYQASGSAVGGGGLPSTGPGGWVMPVRGATFTSGFGQRWGRLHAGVDLAAPIGTPVYAAAMGTVSRAGWLGGYGYSIDINHGGGVVTRYAHLSAMYVAAGTTVQAGQQIGAVGSTGNSTGPHLHFEIRRGGQPVNPAPELGLDG